MDAVAQAEQDLGADVRRLIYLAVPPHAFAPMVDDARRLGAHASARRLIIEKPFGTTSPRPAH